MQYPNPESKSAAMFQQAQEVLTDGGSRSTIRIAPYSIFVKEAEAIVKSLLRDGLIDK